jgi:CDP-diacylglycerol--glycerol-3-phosphate 3-phosphatidyltransferase
MRTSTIPSLLIYSRLCIGFLILLLCIFPVSHYSAIAVTLLVIGLLTDIFDGIIARKLNVSTEKLRRLDSTVDQVFFVTVTISTWLQCPGFFKENMAWLIILVATEALTYLLCFLKFKKEIATHSIGAKIWTLLLCATLIQVMLQCQSGIIFMLCFWVGIITRLEIIGIILALKAWANDVPTFYHALQLRKGKAIKRNKLFNG